MNLRLVSGYYADALLRMPMPHEDRGRSEAEDRGVRRDAEAGRDDLSAVVTTWYDLFSLFYDRALEDLYAPFRSAAVDALALSAGACVLDVPCGTGQSFDGLVSVVGPSGTVLGVDTSTGMLRQARRRVQARGWDNVIIRRSSAADVNAALLSDVIDRPHVDGVLCALGLTALPQWEETFEALFGFIRPGGRFVLFDVYAAERTSASRSVELVARADLSREGVATVGRAVRRLQARGAAGGRDEVRRRVVRGVGHADVTNHDSTEHRAR